MSKHIDEQDRLVLAIPSKGRLMEKTLDLFASVGLPITKTGPERGYRGQIDSLPTCDVMFTSASEIAAALRHGRVHLGVTGEDLVREEVADPDTTVKFLKQLEFGHANVVVAVPACWVDVRAMRDLAEIGFQFRQKHNRRMRVATKYTNLTRAQFNRHAVPDYRIVESLGATEGTPSAGTAELIVDITSTGATLEANGLKILEDGVILRSQANLIASKSATWRPAIRAVENEILDRIGV